jgi:hypothetical protein
MPLSVSNAALVTKAQMKFDTYTSLEEHLREGGSSVSAKDLRKADMALNVAIQKHLVDSGHIAATYFSLNGVVEHMRLGDVHGLTAEETDEAIKAYPVPMLGRNNNTTDRPTKKAKVNDYKSRESIVQVFCGHGDSFKRSAEIMKGPIVLDPTNPCHDATIKATQVYNKTMKANAVLKKLEKKENAEKKKEEKQKREEEEKEDAAKGKKGKSKRKKEEREKYTEVPVWCPGLELPRPVNKTVFDKINAIVAPYTKAWDQVPPAAGGLYWVWDNIGAWHNKPSSEAYKMFAALVPYLRRWCASGMLFPGYEALEISHVSLLWSKATDLHVEEPRTCISGIGVANLPGPICVEMSTCSK